MKNQFAVDSLKEYQKQLDGLSNSYCQLKERYPNKEFHKIAGAIWRTQALIDIYGSLSRCFHYDVYNVDDYNDDVPF